MEICETADLVQRQLYGIAIFEEEIVLADFTGGAERRFCITPEQLMLFFRTDGVTFRPFPGLIEMKESSDKKTWLLTLPAGPRTILYKRKKKILDRKLTLPSMVVRVTVASDSSVIQSLNLWGFAGATLKPESILYALPLPNVGKSNMCLGGQRPIGDDIRAGVEAAIFDSVFNHHNDVVGLERLSFFDYHRKYKGRVPLRTLPRIGFGRELLGGGR